MTLIATPTVSAVTSLVGAIGGTGWVEIATSDPISPSTDNSTIAIAALIDLFFNAGATSVVFGIGNAKLGIPSGVASTVDLPVVAGTEQVFSLGAIDQPGATAGDVYSLWAKVNGSTQNVIVENLLFTVTY